MQVAFAMSTPTSTTLVATRIFVSPARNLPMISRCSSSGIFEWMSAAVVPGKMLSRRLTNMSSADLSESASDWSMSGYTKYA